MHCWYAYSLIDSVVARPDPHAVHPGNVARDVAVNVAQVELDILNLQLLQACICCSGGHMVSDDDFDDSHDDFEDSKKLQVASCVLASRRRG